MSKNPHSALGFRLLMTSVSIFLIAIILIKPFTHYIAGEDAESIEMSVSVDENDFEEEVMAEYHPDYLYHEIVENATSEPDERLYGLSREKTPLSIYGDILIPPPKI